MPEPKKFNTELSRAELNIIFQRVLNSMTDEEINAKFAEIEARISALETEAEENA